MANLTYGTLYRIQNGYNGWMGGYLDTRGNGCAGNVLCVSTATSFDRDQGSGTWQILSATGTPQGQPVVANDLVFLLNQYQGNGGYLDTRTAGCEGNLLCVSTAETSNRDQGSGTWRIITDSSGGNVQEDEVVHLLNGYANFTGGFLDTRGAGCKENLYCVSTSENWNRDTGSTYWRFHEQ
jgi:hypothetical protein